MNNFSKPSPSKIPMNILKVISVLTSLVMLAVLLGGALVTKTGSGMGCGRSWPLCHGQLIPDSFPIDTIIELAHRIVSTSAGILIIVMAVLSWKLIGHIRETKPLALISFIFVVIQGLIGAAAVVWPQSDFVLAAHFGISLISLASVVLLTLLVFEVDKKFNVSAIKIPRKLWIHTIGVTIYSYIVVYTGALVRHTEASLVCSGWPLCRNGEYILPENMVEWIQMGHRTAAGLIFVWILYIFLYVLRNHRHVKVFFYGWMIAFILVALQALSGMLVVVTGLNLFIALAHALFVSLLFALLAYLIMVKWRAIKE
ncbi:COX15/CtaA family protein [Mangrovibacillus cuniculi]|nr:heme A synthase [Mangrovibacillus cuniculi]